ncbi:hypothetical protein CRUP_020791 [Coryphaenoides rupestris]|nr:hypothetical protein CRUP_020791 [Coryphaenoides rupestris]
MRRAGDEGADLAVYIMHEGREGRLSHSAAPRRRDIDECAEGLIKCHNQSHCVNLPGWYHCECRVGFHDNGSYLLDGSSCAVWAPLLHGE